MFLPLFCPDCPYSKGGEAGWDFVCERNWNMTCTSGNLSSVWHLQNLVLQLPALLDFPAC